MEIDPLTNLTGLTLSEFDFHGKLSTIIEEFLEQKDNDCTITIDIDQNGKVLKPNTQRKKSDLTKSGGIRVIISKSPNGKLELDIKGTNNKLKQSFLDKFDAILLGLGLDEENDPRNTTEYWDQVLGDGDKNELHERTVDPDRLDRYSSTGRF